MMIKEVNNFTSVIDKRSVDTIIEVNALAVVCNTFKRRIGEGAEFENTAGFSTISDGLMGIYRDLVATTGRMIDVQSAAELSDHGLEHGLATIETKVEVLNTKVQDLDADHGILILGQQEIA
ncbi:unnamed protein product [Cylindrotheca closterium]|uniref:Uncharacterized protein n=1 Tax=Cylindrotheca closterium TaxID=2856 RepID=A0AAD2CIC9_9STRA|nr:unnamed protein product [Cylindrotheca closterium]